jgi:hypothetical protein
MPTIKLSLLVCRQNNLIVIATIVLGLIGGLKTILQLLIPAIVTIAFTIRDRFRHRHADLPPTPKGEFNCQSILLQLVSIYF